jgi:uncharacterized damage-inducible protein DinB
MPDKARLLAEFDQEMKYTRKVLERVPEGKGEWKPHPKSFSLGHLAQLVSWMPGWIGQALRNPSLDLGDTAEYSQELPATLLAGFEKGAKESREAIEQAKDDDWESPWSLTKGDTIFMSMPRMDVVRMHINHLVHHRAQLGVYLRLLDVPVPAMYGPSADEGWS